MNSVSRGSKSRPWISLLMYYVLTRPTFDSEWLPLKNNEDDTRLSFVSEMEAILAARELAQGSTEQFIAVNSKGKYVSCVYSTTNPYENLV